MGQTVYEGADKMPYPLITALIFALVAILHGWRIFKGWDRADWTPFRVHDCFVGRPYRGCAARGLGLFAEHLARAATSPLGSQVNAVRPIFALGH